MPVSVSDIMEGLDTARRHDIEASAAVLIAKEHARRESANLDDCRGVGSKQNVFILEEYRKRSIDYIQCSRVSKPTKAELEAALDELADILTDDAPNIKNWITKRIAWHRQRTFEDLGLGSVTAALEQEDPDLQSLIDGGEGDHIYDNQTYLEFRNLLDMLLLDGAMMRAD